MANYIFVKLSYSSLLGVMANLPIFPLKELSCLRKKESFIGPYFSPFFRRKINPALIFKQIYGLVKISLLP